MKFVNALKKGFFGFLDLFGFKRSTKYVSNYLHDANMRSGIYMSAVIVLLEIWLIIRQTIKYVAPGMATFFRATSIYWLFLFLGLAMMAYCLYYLSEKHRLSGMIITLSFAGIGLLVCTHLFFENRFIKLTGGEIGEKLVDAILLILLYASVAITQISIILATIAHKFGIKNQFLKSVLIITLFAACCLIFGMRVSYGDWFLPNQVDEMKQLICFLMMSIYVACLLIWKPYVSISVLGVIFFGFYALLKYGFDSGRRDFPEGDFINYITFFISVAMVAVSIYNQRIREARKDEELEILATKDKLTGLLAFEYFTTLCTKRLESGNKVPQDYIYIFLNVTDFKVYNDQRGFDEGNKFLKNVGDIIAKEFKNDLVSRQSDDHYVVFALNDGIKQKLLSIEQQVEKLDLDIRPGLKAGGYILEDLTMDPHSAVEKARYACATVEGLVGYRYGEYDQKMHDRFNMIQYIVHHVDEAIEKGYVVAYYQPVVYSNTNKLCGVEALARWIDPKYGFMNPGIFISALEDAQLAYKVDLWMLELVCMNMRKVLDAKGKIVPTSINFSRTDFSIIDVPNEIERITKKYDIPHKYLHVEITESALLDDHVDLKETMKKLKEKGFEIWLDDFGSGYSSFNSLKDYDFDVLKLDMEFLKGFHHNDKAKPLIKSVIEMADQIGMRTLAEGVETDDQAEYLKKIKCGRLQGYLFGKPMSYEDLNLKIKKGELVIASKII